MSSCRPLAFAAVIAPVLAAGMAGMAVTLVAPAGLRASGAEHPHHVSVLLDATSHGPEWTPHFTTGLEYEYRLPVWDGLLGVFVEAEVVIAEGTPLVFLGGVAVHPWAGLRTFVAGGTELAAEDPHPHGLVRMGVGYDFEVWRLTLSPTFAADWLQGNHWVFVYGLSLGVGF